MSIQSTQFSFELQGTDPHSAARCGVFHTTHGSVETPVFMPVGTQGTVKGVTPDQLEGLGAQIVLGNTYHLYLRPGTEVVEALGGLHKMMAWDRPILTDSGGFQVYSLRTMSKITEEGVTFQSHIDGDSHHLTPEKAIAIQECLGSDIMMAFDECPPARAEKKHVQTAMERTHRWAKRCIDARTRDDNALFGIVQGGVEADLRTESARVLTQLPFEGFALGGLSVGEAPELTYAMVEHATGLLPAAKPRYLMGVGTPEDLLNAIGHGIDMFDCVMPTRNARNGRLYTSRGEINIRNSVHRLDPRPIDAACSCYTCTHYSRGMLRHLNRAKEILFSTLTSVHNLHYYVNLIKGAREAIQQGVYVPWRAELLAARQDSDTPKGE
jgi:queuine tRNA-ribosyltransferase